MTRFKQHKELPIKYIQHKLKEFFNEDDIDNDLTTQLIFSSEKETEAVFIAKENLVLWKDMEAGIIREPNKKIVVLDKYKRPNLTSYIPVTSTGSIRSPFESGYAREVLLNLTKSKYAFGDHSPVETAWRRSSDYPFSILKAFLLHQPAKVIGIGSVSYTHLTLPTKRIV